MKISPNEIELKGSWNFDGKVVTADAICERIEFLTSNYLIEIGIDESGWNKLYQDPEDSRYWELTYPDSEMEGGGAPLLRNLSIEEALKKYEI